MQTLYHNRFTQICRCPQLCDIPMGDITKRLVLDFMHARIQQDGMSPATSNREMAIIKCMLSRAVEWDILSYNPLSGLKTLREAEKRDVNITFEQAAALIRELSEPTASIVSFAIYTGFRKENILGLKIEQVRFHDVTPTGEVELVVKGGRREIFPLSPAAMEPYAGSASLSTEQNCDSTTSAISTQHGSTKRASVWISCVCFSAIVT